MNQFSPETVKRLRYYVYALVDTRRPKSDPMRYFYIGKGKDQRCFHHARAEVKWNKRSDGTNPKLKTIRSVRKSTGKPPGIEILCHGLNDEQARAFESILIKVLRTDPSRRTTERERDAACNRTGGLGARSLCLSVGEIDGMYSNPLHEGELASVALLVNLNGGGDLPPYPKIRPGDLERRVLRYWRIAPERADKVDYILGVYQQLVRVVYKVSKRPDGRARYCRYDCGAMRNGRRNMKTGFLGERCAAKERQWGNRRIINSSGKVLTKFPRQVGCQLIGTQSKK